MYKLASEYVKDFVICLDLLIIIINWYCTLGSFGGSQCDAGVSYRWCPTE